MSERISLSEYRGYDPPTWRLYDDQQQQWLEWKRQAATLAYNEIRRHASVSTDNRHSCSNCFCCACRSLLEELRGRDA